MGPGGTEARATPVHLQSTRGVPPAAPVHDSPGMTGPVESAEARAARELEADRERIDERLRESPPPRIESMLRGERSWVERQRRALVRVKVRCDAVLHAGRTAAPVVVLGISVLCSAWLNTSVASRC